MFSNFGRYPNRLRNVTPLHRSILESVVTDTILQSGWENFVVAVPFVGILLVGLFRLDEIIASPKRDRAVKRPASGCDEHGHLLLSDPDGHLWGASSKTR
jgi:hypothetical protein